jgi:hypothetical protein
MITMMIRDPRSDQSALALGLGRASPAQAVAEFAFGEAMKRGR